MSIGSNSASFDPPDREARKPLSESQTDAFYKAACQMDNIVTELCGRTLLDYGLRVAELEHCWEEWVVREAHPENGRLRWGIRIPQGARCVGGVGETGEGNQAGANLHDTNQPCHKCRTRAYGSKDWVDDEFHSRYPFHPKSERSIDITWSLPKSSSEETASKLSDFLKPDRQFPILRGAISTRLDRIAEEAGLSRSVEPHALRHTYGARLASADCDLKTIMNQMRHANYEQAEYYSKLRGARARNKLNSQWDDDEEF